MPSSSSGARDANKPDSPDAKKSNEIIVTVNRKKYEFPVTYTTFKQYINRTELLVSLCKKEKAKRNNIKFNATFCDHLLRQFYQCFYIAPHQRNKYKWNFHFAPKAIKQLLLQPGKPLEEDLPLSSPSVTTTNVNEMGKNMEDTSSIVSLAVFEQYVTNLHEIAWKQKLSDSNYACLGFEDCAIMCYLAFYITPEIRDKYEWKLKPCPAAIKRKIYSLPSHKEVQALLRQYPEAQSYFDISQISSSGSTCKENVMKDGQSRDGALPVPFSVFKRCIQNLDEIVQQMLMHCNEYKGYSHEQCAQAYYKAFYARPEVRKSFPFILKPCPSSLREKLLSLPSTAISENQPQQQHTARDEFTRARIEKDGIKYEFPVSFETFKRFINKDELIVELAKATNKAEEKIPKILKSKSKSTKLLMGFYYLFYTDRAVRKLFNYNFNSATPEMRKQLLQMGEIIHEPNKPIILENIRIDCPIPGITNDIATRVNDEPQKTTVDEPPTLQAEEEPLSPLPESVPENFSTHSVNASDLNSVRPVEQEPQTNEVINRSNSSHCSTNCDPSDNESLLPVTFSVFKRYIGNLEEIVQQMVQCSEYKGCDAKQCAKKYYEAFYLQPQIRETFAYKLRPCPGSVRKKLLSLSSPIMHSDNQPEIVRPSHEVNGILYEFPVPFETFQKFINYDELVAQLVKATNMPEQKMAKVKANKKKCTKLLLRYYNMFYTDRTARRMFIYNFNAATPAMRKRLTEFAQEIVVVKPKVIEHMEVNENVVEEVNQPETTSNQPEVNPCDVANEMQLNPCSSTTNVEEIPGVEIDEVKPEIEEHMEVNENVVEVNQPSPAETNSNQPVIANEIQPNPCSAPPKDIPCDKFIKPPITFNAFKKLLNLSEIVKQLQQDKAFAGMTVYQCEREYYNAFYTRPEIRLKYKYTVNMNLLNSHIIPPTQSVAEHSYAQLSIPSEASKNTTTDSENIADIYAKRKDALESMEKHIVEFLPHNLRDYIASKTECPKKRLLIEEKFLSNGKEESVIENPNPTTTVQETGNGKQQLLDDSREQIAARLLFFAEHTEEHSLRYLIANSFGLKYTIWRILSELSFKEFKNFTGIHNGQEFYNNADSLRPFYQHVIDMGAWPINLYVRMNMIKDLLQKKGVSVQSYNLEQLSPKMLHWCELMVHTNFDEIVELTFFEKTGKPIESLTVLHEEREKFYLSCWTHDEWIRKVPSPMESNKNTISLVPSESPKLLPDLSVLRDVSIFDQETRNSQIWEDKNHSLSPLPTQCEEVDKLPTGLDSQDLQLTNTPSFVDMENVCAATQLELTQNDPLMQSMQFAKPIEIRINSQFGSQDLRIKQEPIKFLNNLRFESNSNSHDSDSFICQTINPEDQIINIEDDDDNDDVRASLACFQQRISDADEELPQLQLSNDIDINSVEIINDETEHQDILLAESPKVVVHQLQDDRINRRRKIGTENSSIPAKRIKVMSNFVPQIRHGFRALPLGVATRLEVPECSEEPQQQQTQESSNNVNKSPATGAPASATISISQALATDNTLFNSTQLGAAVDAAYVTIRKVNTDANSNNQVGSDDVVFEPQRQLLSLHSNILCRSLKRFVYFKSLTAAHIAQHHIPCNAVGESYQQALIDTASHRCFIYGPLLNTLFASCPPQVIDDLHSVLQDLGEFRYSSRTNISMAATEDLRARVVHNFMRLAPPFARFRLQFENESREWASCSSVIESTGTEDERRQRRCNLAKAIRPDILELMKSVKHSLN